MVDEINEQLQSSLILKNPIVSLFEDAVTKTTRFFSKSPAKEYPVVELEAPDIDFKIKNIVDIGHIKNIDDFTKKFVEELQISSNEKEEQLKEYVQDIVQQYFSTKEPDIQQYINEKLENVINKIVNIDKQQVTYQNVLQKTIEQIVNQNNITKEYQQNIFETFTTVEPEVVKESLQKIFQNSVQDNTVNLVDTHVIEKSINTLQQLAAPQNDNVVETGSKAPNISVAESIEKAEANKTESINQELLSIAPQSSSLGASLAAPTISMSSTPSITNISENAPVIPQSAPQTIPTMPQTELIQQDPHTNFYGYPGFTGISELS